MKYRYAAIAAFAAKASAAPRTSAPDGCSTVSAAGGDFTTVQAAVDAAAEGGCIFLDKGVYDEQVFVDDKANLTIFGHTEDDVSYVDNGATITHGISQDDVQGNDLTGTLRVHSANFKLYNVNVHNTRGEGRQAVAVSAREASGYYGCSFSGFQDTLFADKKEQVYINTEIIGATDFIFGQRGFAWFENCDLRVLPQKPGFVTANGAANPGESKYVFNGCDVAAKDGEKVEPGDYFLGRPWGIAANVVFQNSSLSDVINPAGWAPWSDAEPVGANVSFAEFENNGPGANGPRAAFASVLKKPVSIEDVLGPGFLQAGYYDANYGL